MNVNPQTGDVRADSPIPATLSNRRLGLRHWEDRQQSREFFVDELL